MLPKIAHYGGFQSYGDLAYPSLKPGKKQLESNTIYQETVRREDDLKVYENINRWKTVYDQDLSKTVQPEHYENPLRVTKQQIEKPLMSQTHGNFSTLRSPQSRQNRTAGSSTGFQAAGESSLHNKGLELYNKTLATLKKEGGGSPHTLTYTNFQGQLQNDADPKDEEYVQNGTEHWKTTYVAAIKDPYASAKATRPEWSLHKEPHQVENGPIASDYKRQFGERGTNPLDKLDRFAHMPPVPKSDEDLKLGTTQSTFHIPGYTGHMPRTTISPDRLDQTLGVNTRTTFLKQNITENYQTRIPGYSGHRPANAINDRGSLRQFCFSTVGERFQ